MIEPADWDQEAVERARLERETALLELEPAESLESLPAPKRGKSKTPNLDQARQIVAELKGRP